MINVFTKHGFTDTWEAYLHEWGGEDAKDFTVNTYESLAGLCELPAGPIIFCDIERLTNADRALATDVVRVVSETRPDILILNDPTATLRRYDLLSELHNGGLNPFRAYRLTDTITPERFPVFVRYENDHTGATTELLENQQELNRAIIRLRIRRHDLRQLIIVEYLDTRAGKELYVKYSAFKVGNVIIARSAKHGTHWVVKYRASLKNLETETCEFAYVRDSPHLSLLHAPFAIGGIGYGRIDYSMLGESLVTWEINTNPTIMSELEDTYPPSFPREDLFLSRFNVAFDILQSEPIDPSPISLRDVSPELRARSRDEPTMTPSAVQRFGKRNKRWLEPVVRVVETAAIPFQKRILDRCERTNAS